MKHTKGEWIASKNPTTEQILIKEGTDVIENDNAALSFVSGDTPEESEANAVLMAAAPELLEALKLLHARCVIADDNEDLSSLIDGNLLDKANEAIKKATQ